MATKHEIIDELYRRTCAGAAGSPQAWRFGQELTDLYPTGYRYEVGDKLYLGTDEYNITAVHDGMISLQNPKFQLSGQEMSETELSAKLALPDANDHLKVFVAPARTEEKIPDATPEEALTVQAEPPQKESETQAHAEIEAVYPAVENGLPYDIVIEKLHIDERQNEVPITSEQPQQTFSEEPSVVSPSTPTIEKHNFRITNDALGVGSPKEKFRNNLAAIKLLHELQEENRLATPAEQNSS